MLKIMGIPDNHMKLMHIDDTGKPKLKDIDASSYSMFMSGKIYLIRSKAKCTSCNSDIPVLGFMSDKVVNHSPVVDEDDNVLSISIETHENFINVTAHTDCIFDSDMPCQLKDIINNQVPNYKIVKGLLGSNQVFNGKYAPHCPKCNAVANLARLTFSGYFDFFNLDSVTKELLFETNDIIYIDSSNIIAVDLRDSLQTFN